MNNQFPISTGISPEYIMALERRVMQLESQIQQLENQLSQQQSLLSSIDNKLPNTSMLSPKFLTRAFSVWGHLIVAQLIIAVSIYVLILIFGVGNLFGY